MSEVLARHWWPLLAAVASGGTVETGSGEIIRPTDQYSNLEQLITATQEQGQRAAACVGIEQPFSVVTLTENSSDEEVDDFIRSIVGMVDRKDRSIGPVFSEMINAHDVDTGEDIPAMAIEAVAASGHSDSPDSLPSAVLGMWVCLPLSSPTSGWGGFEDPGPVVHIMNVVDREDGILVYLASDLLRISMQAHPSRQELYETVTQIAYHVTQLAMSAAIVAEKDPVGFIDGDDHMAAALAGGAAGEMTVDQVLSVMRKADKEHGDSPMSAVGGLLLAQTMPEDLDKAGWSISPIMARTGVDRLLALHPTAGAYLVHLGGPDNLMVEPLDGGGDTAMLSAEPDGDDGDGLSTALQMFLRSLSNEKP